MGWFLGLIGGPKKSPQSGPTHSHTHGGCENGWVLIPRRFPVLKTSPPMLGDLWGGHFSNINGRHTIESQKVHVCLWDIRVVQTEKPNSKSQNCCNSCSPGVRFMTLTNWVIRKFSPHHFNQEINPTTSASSMHKNCGLQHNKTKHYSECKCLDADNTVVFYQKTKCVTLSSRPSA